MCAKNISKPPNKRPRGRPRSSRIKLQLKLLPEVDALIEKRAAEQKIPKGQYLERLVLADPHYKDGR